MDAALRQKLDVLAQTAMAFYGANRKRNVAYEWMTANEQYALANLREALDALDREAAKQMAKV